MRGIIYLRDLVQSGLQPEYYPQQLPSLQSQEGGPPVIMLLMMAAAQPTPEFTEIAPKSQFKVQAPHSMHRSRSVIAARLSCILKTPCGQTSTQRPHPAHFSELYLSVVTFERYFMRAPIPSA
jgi:hypothetical protein